MKRNFWMSGALGLVWLFFTTPLAPAQGVQTQLYRSPSTPKWSALFADRLQTTEPSWALKIWVFFTDKGIRSERELQEVLSAPQAYLTKRALRRRAKLGRRQLAGFADLPVYEPYVQQILSTGARIRARSRWLNAVSVWATPGQIAAIARKPFVARLRLVAGARPRRPEPGLEKATGKLTPVGIEAPPYHLDYGPSQAQLEQIAVPQLHELGYTGKGVLVAMLDVGYYKDHETFAHLRVVGERDFVMKDNDTQRDPNDPNDYSDSHGTLTWSTLAGFTPGELIGPAYQADFLLAKTEDVRSETPVEEDYWAAAAEWADSLGADVISSSLGYYDWYRFKDMDGNTAVCTIAADWAAKQGIAVVVAAGNWNTDPNWGHISAPADGDSVISVGAVTLSGTIADFSSRGPTYDGRIKPEVCALGVHTHCATRGGPNSYGHASGTSLSTPLIGGVCALLLEAHPDWTGWDVREALLQTASQADHPDNTYGWGIANAFAASGIQAAVPALTQLSLDEPAETSNGVVDPGEVLHLNLTIKNVGNVQGTGQVVLRSADPYVVLRDSTVRLLPLDPGQSADLRSAFEFVASDSLPAGHAVDLTLLIELGERQFERSVRLPGAGGYGLSGSVWDFGQNGPAPHAAVLARPLNEPLAATQVFFADAHGEFSFVLPAGEYAFQAWAQGAVPTHAVRALVPQSDPGSLHLSIFRPSLGLYPPKVLKSDNRIKVQLDVDNRGSGPLFVSVSAAAGSSGGVWESSGRAILWRDLDEKALLDLSELDAQWDSAQVTLELVHWRKPGTPELLGWKIYLDLDDSADSGDSLGSDLILQVTQEPAAVTAYAVVDGVLRLLPDLHGEVSTSPGRLYVRLPVSVFQDVALWVPVRVEAQEKVGEEYVTFDLLPDSARWRAVLPTFHPRGLQIQQPLITLAAGQMERVTIEISDSSAASRLDVGLASWDPVEPWKTVSVDLTTGVEDAGTGANLPATWALSRAYPNPFNGATAFQLAVPEPTQCVVEVVDLRGRVVRTLFRGRLAPGAHTLRWDGRTDASLPASSGLYLLRVVAGDRVLGVRKLLYLR